MTPEKRRELLDMVKSAGLRFSAICGDLGHGFGDATLNPQLIEKNPSAFWISPKTWRRALSPRISA